MTADITKFVTLILGISLSGERLVTLIKTFFPNLAAPPASSGEFPADSATEITKKALLMVIAFLSCLLSAFLINKMTVDPITIGSVDVPIVLIALLASGGSAFWTNILGYVSSLKDLNSQKALQAKLTARMQLTGSVNPSPALLKIGMMGSHGPLKKASTGNVSFSSVFSGGPGTLKIKISGYPDIDLKDNDTRSIDLPPGNYLYSAAGGAATGDGAGCILTIGGDVIVDSPLKFGPGLIYPNIHPLIVTG